MATVHDVGDDKDTFLQRFEAKLQNAMRVLMSGESQELNETALNDALRT